MNSKPCPYRHVGAEGHILCEKIKTGDREVTPNVCRACPVAQINCAHLRATLNHTARPPIVVRYGNGKTEVWDDPANDTIALDRAACAERVLPIHAPRDCAGCGLRAVASEQATINSAPAAVTRRQTTRRAPRVAPAPVPAPVMAQVAPAPLIEPAAPLAPTAEARSKSVAAKIIQLQEWLTQQHRTPHKSDAPAETTAPPLSTARPARVIGEEKRVGWTD